MPWYCTVSMRGTAHSPFWLGGAIQPQPGLQPVDLVGVPSRVGILQQRLKPPGSGVELGFGGAEGDNMVVVANTPAVHNMIVCTLCSCYPWPVLGLPPAWYKSLAYRARIVREPRAVLREFGLEIPPSVEVRVWDSSAEMRYLVLPERPPSTEGMSEAELVALITRDSLVGVATVKTPGR